MQENPRLTLSCRWGLLRAKVFGVCHSSNFHSLLLQIQWKLCLKTMPSAEGEWEETLEWPSSSARLIGNCVKDVMSGQQQPTCPSVYNPPFFCRKDQTECVLCDNRSICCYYSILSRASKSNTVCLLRQACVFTEICLGLHSLRCLRACVCNCLFSPDLFSIIIN